MEQPETASAAPPAPNSPEGGRPLTSNSIHFVRTLQQITLTYSQMADQKASMLMAATFVVFTIAVGQARGGPVPIALTILALFAFASALCAIFAVLPSVRSPKGAAGSANAIFFGVFALEPEDEWIERTMHGLTKDEVYYRLMLRDIHQNGVVLERKKYRWLGRAYRLFVAGLCLTALAFVLELFGVFGGS